MLAIPIIDGKKRCSKCKQYKSFDDFNKNRRDKHGIASQCRKCVKDTQQTYFKKNPWYVHYKCSKNRCEDKTNPTYSRYGGKGIKMLMTINDFKVLWNRDKAWLLKRPSVDRIDGSKHYTPDNCRFMELSDNVKRSVVSNLPEEHKKRISASIKKHWKKRKALTDIVDMLKEGK